MNISSDIILFRIRYLVSFSASVVLCQGGPLHQLVEPFAAELFYSSRCLIHFVARSVVFQFFKFLYVVPGGR